MAYHPDNIEKFASRPGRCLFGTSPTLTDLRIAYGGRGDMQWLIVQLSTWQEKMNVPTKMTAWQVESCAQSITEAYGHLKASEIALFLARLLGGAYTVDWYGSVSPDKILQALREQFMPWRNNQFYIREKRMEEQRRDESIGNPNNITYEQWLKEKQERGEEVSIKTNPIKI